MCISRKTPERANEHRAAENEKLIAVALKFVKVPMRRAGLNALLRGYEFTLPCEEAFDRAKAIVLA